MRSGWMDSGMWWVGGGDARGVVRESRYRKVVLGGSYGKSRMRDWLVALITGLGEKWSIYGAYHGYHSIMVELMDNLASSRLFEKSCNLKTVRGIIRRKF